MIRLVLSDVDGTILPFGAGIVDDDTKEAIAALEEAGIVFAPASGRPVTDIDFAFQDTTHTTTCVSSNGMVVFDRGRIVVDMHLPSEKLQLIAEKTSACDNVVLGLCYNEEDDPTQPMQFAFVGANERALEMLQQHLSYMNTVIALDRVPDQHIYVSGFFSPLDNSAQGAIGRLIEAASDVLHTTHSAPGYNDISLKSWNKAKGAEALMRDLGVERDEVVFMGDSMNDISLFEYFENSFCAASGHKAAKDLARWIMPDPQDGGAIALLSALARNKGNLSAALEDLGWDA